MKKNKLLQYMVFLSIIIFLSIFLLIKPQITGFVILGGGANGVSTVTWDFSDSDDYYYNDSSIDLSGNEAKLKTITNSYTFTHSDFENGTLSNMDIVSNGISPIKNTVTYHITQALYDPNDKTSKVNSLDNNKLEVEEDEILNIVFETALDN